MTTACATKGFVRQEVSTERTAREQAIEQERMARMAADSTTSADITALRTDLQAMRTEFGAKIAQVEEGLQFAFPVNFAFDDATVRQEDQAALDRFAQVAQKYYNGSKITVEGFADPAGGARYNVALSKRRAENVRQYLVSKGLSDAQLSTVGYGKTRLVNPGAQRDEPGAEQNRRVVFVIETKGESSRVTASASME